MIPEVPIEAAGTIIQPRIRNVDLMIKWGEGTAVFFPCLPPTESHRVAKRLFSALEHSPQLMSVEFGALFHPILATGILSEEISI
jgi:hypothetical protein